MEMQKNAINWVEIPVSDFGRAKKFYSTIYDYEMPEMMMGAQQMGFLLFDQPDSGVGGAIVKGEAYVPSHDGAKIYLNAGIDLNVVLNKVEDAGGKVVTPKMQITPELGHFATFEDTEGNLIFLHSAK